MKNHARRATGNYPYFKLAIWDSVSCTWRDGRKAFPSTIAAMNTAVKPGRYRLSKVTDTGREDLEPFNR